MGAVVRWITSWTVIPIAMNFDMTLERSFMPAFMLLRYRSVLIVFGLNPCCRAGIATLH